MPYIPQPINFNVGQGAAAAGTPVSEELWSTPNASNLHIGCNGSSWRGAFMQTSATTTFLGKTLTKLTLRLYSFDGGSTDESFSVGVFDTTEVYTGTPLGTLSGKTNNNELTGSWAYYDYEGDAGVISSGNAIGFMIDRSDGVSDNLVQILCNTSASLTGCDDIQYSQTNTAWDYDPYINGSLLIGQGYGY